MIEQGFATALLQTVIDAALMQQTLMKDARRGLHSLVEDSLPAGSLLELNEHSPAQVLNLFPSTRPSHVTWHHIYSLGPLRKPVIPPPVRTGRTT